MSVTDAQQKVTAPAATDALFGLGELRAMLMAPAEFFRGRLAEPPSPQQLFFWRVTPYAAIRPVAVLLRSLLGGAPLAGVVLGLGSFALQVGTWLGLGLVLPALARQFEVEIDERRGFALVTYASMPLWAAGGLYLVPEQPALVYWWSRLVVLLIAIYAVFLLRQGVAALGLPRGHDLPLVVGIALAGVLIYGVLFVLLGISSHVALFVLG